MFAGGSLARGARRSMLWLRIRDLTGVLLLPSATAPKSGLLHSVFPTGAASRWLFWPILAHWGRESVRVQPPAGCG
jgi:hypothetical protein